MGSKLSIFVYSLPTAPGMISQHDQCRAGSLAFSVLLCMYVFLRYDLFACVCIHVCVWMCVV